MIVADLRYVAEQVQKQEILFNVYLEEYKDNPQKKGEEL